MSERKYPRPTPEQGGKWRNNFHTKVGRTDIPWYANRDKINSMNDHFPKGKTK